MHQFTLWVYGPIKSIYFNHMHFIQQNWQPISLEKCIHIMSEWTSLWIWVSDCRLNREPLKWNNEHEIQYLNSFDCKNLVPKHSFKATSQPKKLAIIVVFMITTTTRRRKWNLKSGNMGGEAVNAQSHFPGPLTLRPVGPTSYFPVVLPDSASRIHRKSNNNNVWSIQT